MKSLTLTSSSQWVPLNPLHASFILKTPFKAVLLNNYHLYCPKGILSSSEGLNIDCNQVSKNIVKKKTTLFRCLFSIRILIFCRLKYPLHSQHALLTGISRLRACTEFREPQICAVPKCDTGALLSSVHWKVSQ